VLSTPHWSPALSYPKTRAHLRRGPARRGQPQAPLEANKEFFQGQGHICSAPAWQSRRGLRGRGCQHGRWQPARPSRSEAQSATRRPLNIPRAPNKQCVPAAASWRSAVANGLDGGKLHAPVSCSALEGCLHASVTSVAPPATQTPLLDRPGACSSVGMFLGDSRRLGDGLPAGSHEHIVESDCF